MDEMDRPHGYGVLGRSHSVDNGGDGVMTGRSFFNAPALFFSSFSGRSQGEHNRTRRGESS